SPHHTHPRLLLGVERCPWPSDSVCGVFTWARARGQVRVARLLVHVALMGNRPGTWQAVTGSQVSNNVRAGTRVPQKTVKPSITLDECSSTPKCGSVNNWIRLCKSSRVTLA